MSSALGAVGEWQPQLRRRWGWFLSRSPSPSWRLRLLRLTGHGRCLMSVAGDRIAKGGLARGPALTGKSAGFLLDDRKWCMYYEYQICAYDLLVYKMPYSQSGRRGMTGKKPITGDGRNAGRTPGPIRASGMSSCYAKRTQFSPFLGQKRGCAKRRSQFGWPGRPRSQIHFTALRTATPISDLRFKEGRMDAACKAERAKQSQFVDFWPRNGGAMRKQSRLSGRRGGLICLSRQGGRDKMARFLVPAADRGGSTGVWR